MEESRAHPIPSKRDALWLAGVCDAGRDIDAVAHQVAIALLGHIGEMDADAEFYVASTAHRLSVVAVWVPCGEPGEGF
jgi:hypothetical protein